MLCVTHEMSFARDVASRILFLDGGQLVCDSGKDAFFSQVRQENERISKFLSFIGE